MGALRRSERGTALVETLFILPIFVFLLFWAISLGWIYWGAVSTKMAAVESSRTFLAWAQGGRIDLARTRAEAQARDRLGRAAFPLRGFLACTCYTDGSPAGPRCVSGEGVEVFVASRAPVLFQLPWRNDREILFRANARASYDPAAPRPPQGCW